jgi:hypothetical protein
MAKTWDSGLMQFFKGNAFLLSGVAENADLGA